MSVYPQRIAARASRPEKVEAVREANAGGVGASFVCGSFVELSLRIDEEAATIEDASFRTNGCGFMTAAADTLCGRLQKVSLTDLHGLAESELVAMLAEELGEFPAGRSHCAEPVFDALRKSLAAYRERRLEEYTGEKALICTCFGVSEESIVAAISERSMSDVEEVVTATRAGSGCGSCRMLIRELLDTAVAERV